MENGMNDYFRLNKFILKIGALWPPSDKSARAYLLYRVFQATVFFATVIYNIPAGIYGMSQILDDFPKFMEATNKGTTLLLASLKFTTWVVNFERIKATVFELEKETFLYEAREDFDPEAEVRKAKRTGRWISMTIFVSGELTVVFMFVPAIALSALYHLQGRSIANVSYFEELQFEAYMPFDYDTASKYCLASAIQCVLGVYHALIIVGVDTLFTNSLILIGARLSILQDAFRGLRRRCSRKIGGSELDRDGLFNSEELEREMMTEMRRCVRFLQMTLRCCGKLEDAFRYVMLIQTVGSTYIICSCLILVSMVKQEIALLAPVFTTQFVENFIFLFGVMAQMGLVCWLGNEITLRGLDIPQALWESDWLEARKPFQICVFLTMLRMNNPVYMTAGKFVPLILGTYISLLKGAYSFYTMLQATRE